MDGERDDDERLWKWTTTDVRNVFKRRLNISRILPDQSEKSQLQIKEMNVFVSSFKVASARLHTQVGDMDILHVQLAAIQRKLAFVQVDPIDWKKSVLVFSWGICLFESYLL